MKLTARRPGAARVRARGRRCGRRRRSRAPARRRPRGRRRGRRAGSRARARRRRRARRGRARSASASSSPMRAAAGPDVGRQQLRQVLGADHRPPRAGRARPSDVAASTATVHRAVAAGSRARADRDARGGDPSTCTSDSEATAYHRSTPGSPVVSAYGGCGTASTSRPPMVERLERSVRSTAPAHLVADRSRRPAPSRASPGRARRERDQARRAARAGRLGGVAADGVADPRLPIRSPSRAGRDSCRIGHGSIRPAPNSSRPSAAAATSSMAWRQVVVQHVVAAARCRARP